MENNLWSLTNFVSEIDNHLGNFECSIMDMKNVPKTMTFEKWMETYIVFLNHLKDEINVE